MDEKQNSLAMLPLLLAFFVAGSLGTFAAAALPDLQRHFVVSTAEGSLLYVTWGFGIVGGSLIAAYAITGYGPAIILACAAVIGAVAANAATTTESYTIFLLSYGLLGMTSGVIITTGHGFVGRSSNPQSSSNISALDFALSLGTVSAPMLITYFGSGSVDASGWRNVFLSFEVCLLLFAGVVIFQDFGAPLPSRPTSTETGVKQVTGLRMRTLLNPVLIWFAMVSFLHHAFEYGHTYWFVTYAASLPGIGVEKGREILIGFLSGIIVSRLILSWFAARDNMRPVLSIAVAIASALIIFMPEYTEYTPLYMANVAFGIAIGAVFPSLLAVVVSTSDSHGAVFSSVGLISGALGTQLAALLLGAVIQMGAVQGIYTILAIIGIALVICVNLMIRHCVPLSLIGSDPKREEAV